ncbi:MAG: prolyl oligopeptidase family serine peptidase [Saprospiraceae bacterium]|nr:prolyl oligopeptidase family serine peptidase [Saprospiraceae bacterium]
MFTTGDDNVVPVQNSVSYYLALRSKGIPAELHIFEHGNHGLGLLVDDFAIRQWASLLENWLIRWKVLRQ